MLGLMWSYYPSNYPKLVDLPMSKKIGLFFFVLVISKTFVINFLSLNAKQDTFCLYLKEQRKI